MDPPQLFETSPVFTDTVLCFLIALSSGELLVYVMTAHVVNQDVAALPHTTFVALQAKVLSLSERDFEMIGL